MEKIYYTEGALPESQIGAALESLAHTIADRRGAGEESYTYRLLNGNLDDLLKKLVEEAHETTLAAKDTLRSDAAAEEVDHLRYEAGDVVYHLLVLLERCGIELNEFAAELNARMTEEEINSRSGVALLKPEYVNRGSNH
jgi:phosphoribosyl-ATP pyrophosphohydrolase/phosphoribosyl-ATP pyrophosphohydrolase/phosphoribosyl-AMP cyclohydrolase